MLAPTRRRLVAAVLSALTLSLVLGLTPLSPHAVTSSAGASEATDSNEWDFADAVNRERAANGLAPLRVETGLRVIARNWSSSMAWAGTISHNPNLSAQVTQVSWSWTGAGENVGVGYDVAGLHSALMNSPGHRANILGNWNYMGIGVVQAGGRMWVTQVFLRDAASLSTVSKTPPAPVAASWYLRNANTPGSPNITLPYGMPSYQMLACDWNGDGTDSIGVFVGDTFYLRNSNSAGSPDAAIRFGWPGVKAVCGDWNGDGTDTIGIYSGDTFYLRNSNSGGNADLVARYGWSAVTPVVGDWNGDRVDTIGAFIDGTWYLRNSNNGGNPDLVLAYGAAGYKPVVGDWNADGSETIGVYAGDTFYLRDSNSNGSPNAAIAYGAPGWMPVAGDWDHDGRTTIGVVQR
jgi:uncharacterized protein YkwD